MKAAKEEKEERKEAEREDILNYFICVFALLLGNKECLTGLFENHHFSQIRRWNSLVVFGFDRSKFGVFSLFGAFDIGSC